MSKWRIFLDSLDSGGGQIFCLTCLIGFGSFLFFFDPTAGGQMISLSFGALLMKFKDSKSNREQETSVTKTAAVITETE